MVKPTAFLPVSGLSGVAAWHKMNTLSKALRSRTVSVDQEAPDERKTPKTEQCYICFGRVAGLCYLALSLSDAEWQEPGSLCLVENTGLQKKEQDQIYWNSQAKTKKKLAPVISVVGFKSLHNFLATITRLWSTTQYITPDKVFLAFVISQTNTNI